MVGNKLLEVKGLKVEFGSKKTGLTAVDDVSFSIDEREILGLVGESGCGKTMTALAILKLVPFPGKIVKGEVFLKGKNILNLEERQLSKIRGSKIAMIFQDPNTSLNPSFRIGWQIKEVLKTKYKDRSINLDKIIIDMLTKVGIKNASKRFLQYPHQLSGGMRQRIVITMALLMEPNIIIADEPTTALDVTTQKEIFNMIEKIRNDMSISFLVISHDLYLIAERCDRIIVMYGGQIVEVGKSDAVFSNPLHPYTNALIKSIPRLSFGQEKLKIIKGEVLDLINLEKDKCLFRERCDFAKKICSERQPDLINFEDKLVRCHLFK